MKKTIALFWAVIFAAFFLFPVAAQSAAGDEVRIDRQTVTIQKQAIPAILAVSAADLKRLNRFSTRPGFVVPLTVANTKAFTPRQMASIVSDGYKDDPHIV
jgi:hypothetical protein